MNKNTLSIGRRFVLFGLLIAVIFSLTGCLGMPEFEDVDYEVEPTQNKLHSLRYYGRDLDAEEKTVAVIEPALLDTSTEDYGYYFLEYGYSRDSSLIYQSMYTLFFPLLILTPVGLPTDSAEYETYVSLAIFDSNGDLVQRYSKTDSFKQTAGMYYGWYMTDNRLSESFSGLIQEVIEMASRNSDEINETLELIGPINAENRSAATKNLEAYIFEKDVYIHDEDK